MKLLLLGGTVFLGRALTDAALAAGHEVVHFNRGRAPDARVRTVVGDRTGELPAALLGEWDWVLDTSGYLPQAVRRSAAALREHAKHYCFISSVSVYRSFAQDGIDEDAEVAPPPDPPPDAMTGETYGALKAACEAVVREAFGRHALIVRPGLIVGPHDPTDRFTYWPVRIAAGGRVLAPGRPQRLLQFIDVRDLAEWIVREIQKPAHGTFNATGPEPRPTMAELVAACAEAAGTSPELAWMDDAALLAQGVEPWRELPLWIPESDASMRGLMAVSIDRALASGLRFRHLEATAADTLAWARARGPGHAWRAGLDAARERELIAAARGHGQLFTNSRTEGC